MNPERLVQMANAIAANLAAEAGDEAPTAIAAHLRRFWEPRMRAQLQACARTAVGDALSPAVRAAFAHLRDEP